MNNPNKRIAINTIIIYIRLAVVTIVSLLTTRYVLEILGQADYGLFNVVGSIITMLNCISTAMYTTTRRFINIEMGKPDGNLNKIFNISLVLHIGFALFILLICESIGVWYINNYLNVVPEKIADAHFIFQITTIVSCIGIINVPFQSLIEAFEKFWQTAVVDIINTLLKLLIVFILILYTGNNVLRLYAVMLSSLTFFSFCIYQIACFKQWKNIVRFKFYKDRKLYKEILIFNNYTALGAFSFLGRTQGSTILINYFFGTIVNASFAIAFQIQNFVQMFTGNLSTASAPQITQNYSSGNISEAINLCSKMNRYTILLMCTTVFSILVELEFLLSIWLGKIPDGCLILCQWILICALIGSFSTAIPTFIHATGKIKWFQIVNFINEVSLLPIGFILFHLGFPPVSIIILLSILTIVGQCISFILMKYILNFKSMEFIKKTYKRPLLVISLMIVWVQIISTYSQTHPIINIISTGIISLLFTLFIGMTSIEREILCSKLNKKLKNI